ncbi:DVUA0089 family protein [Marivivens marinus]|uniref:DVUA0089 family protein n=1 Tax=Marivivens marinus TaxID=3110173 RepID=UPI003B849939
MKHLARTTAIAGFTTLAFALPAAAQDMCGGIGANGQWIGGTESASDLSIAGGYMEQMALVLGGNQYVALFSLSGTADVRVEAAGRGAGDPVIDLYDGFGNIVVSDDDSGGNGASRAETTLGPGTYCLALRSFDNAPMTSFVRVGTTDMEPLTEGMGDTDGFFDSTDYGSGGGECDANTPAQDIPLGGSSTASVADTPYWAFTLTEPMPVTITAENPDADPIVTLYDGDGNWLGENDDFDGLNSRLDMSAPLAPGRYCVSMTALSDPGAPVTVTVTEYDPVAALAALYDRGESAPPMDGSHPITDLGTVDSRVRIDVQNTTTATWFSVEVPESGLLLIEALAAGGNGDPYLYLYDDLGRLVDQNDDYNGLDSQVVARVNRGTYLIALRELNDGSQGFVRLLVERYVAAQ